MYVLMVMLLGGWVFVVFVEGWNEFIYLRG
jgi:hypothetical protein